jgi:outer membrane PBP1 activator LpoA protein
MKILLRMFKLILPVIVIVGFLASCASHPDEEQIKVLEETKAAALSAEQSLAEKKQETSDLEAKCEAKKAELEKVKKEKETVLKKLEAKKAEESVN